MIQDLGTLLDTNTLEHTCINIFDFDKIRTKLFLCRAFRCMMKS